MKIAQGIGRIVRPSRTLDTGREYLSDDLDATRLSALLKSCDQGEVGDYLQLCEEIESKDPHIQSVAAVRRHGLTALDWRIDADTTDPDKQALADEAAQYCDERLRSIDSFDDFLQHQATAFGTGMAVSEKVWSGAEIVDFVPAPSNRLIGDRMGGPGVYILTDEDMSQGVWVDPIKFCMWTPHLRSGDPFIAAPMRAVARLYLLIRYASTDWAMFAEKFGMPFIIAWIDENLADDHWDEVETALQKLMADSAALFRKSTDGNQVDVEFREVAREAGPYEALIAWAEKKASIAFLGQTLTTEMQDVGARSAAEVHQNIRAGIIRSDLKYEKTAIRTQLLTPMCQWRFPNLDVPVPFFEREIAESVDVDGERLLLEKLRMAKELGLTIDPLWAHDALGVPKAPEQTPAPAPTEN